MNGPTRSMLADHNHDLSELPESKGPWHPNWSNSIAICAIMREEQIADVREWLLYYRCGVNTSDFHVMILNQLCVSASPR
jgi:hypothetical protein